jgi:hypothetical protein
VLLVQLGVCLLARHFGPLAISDDDYARVVIAQELAEHPRLDPTGTSWLPFPFYVTGLGMLLFGSSLEVARTLQLVLALASAALLYFGARRLGLGPFRAALAVGLAACLPTSALLAGATVPEYPTAACLVFALSCLAIEGSTKTDQRWALLGALACFFACGSRYEAWPVAGAYAGVTLCRAVRAKGTARHRTFGIAALAGTFPVLWLLHGAFWHGDPFFFVTRVTQYKAALGSTDVRAALLGYPLAGLRQEPGIPVLLFSAMLAALLTPEGRARLRATWPVFFGLAALLLVLVLGDVRGGAPTHHPERALLSLWLATPAVSLHLLGVSSPLLRPTRQLALTLAILLIAGIATTAPRPPPGAFADRAEEERLGRFLRQLSARETDRIVVLTPDYGYLAVQAASGRPSRFTIVDKNDPREARPELAPEDRALAVLERDRAPFAVLPLGVVVPGYRMIEHGSRLALLEAEAGEARYAWRASH